MQINMQQQTACKPYCLKITMIPNIARPRMGKNASRRATVYIDCSLLLLQNQVVADGTSTSPRLVGSIHCWPDPRLLMITFQRLRVWRRM